MLKVPCDSTSVGVRITSDRRVCWRAVVLAAGFLCSSLALADNSNLSDHERTIQNETEHNTKYHNNADDYPAAIHITPIPEPDMPRGKTTEELRDDAAYEAAIRAEPDRERKFAADKRNAQSGDINAVLDLAMDYRRHFGTEYDPVAAYNLYLSIADRSSKAAFLAGDMRYTGQYRFPGDQVDAYLLMNKAAQAGYPEAITWLKEHPEPVRHLGEFPSMLTYADDVFWEGAVGVQPITLEETDNIIAKGRKGESFFNSMAKLAPKALAAGKANLYGIGVPVDLERAEELFSFAGGALYFVGEEYPVWVAWTVTPTHSRDFATMDRLLNAGSDETIQLQPRMNYLKALLACSLKRPDRQREMLMESVNNFMSGSIHLTEVSQASADLGVMMLEGNGGDRDDARGIALLTSAAKSNRNAQYILGLVYERGVHGVPKDAAMAAKLFQQAASQGQVEAIAHLNPTVGENEQAKAKIAEGNIQQARADSQEESFGKQIVALVRMAPSDYLDHRGLVAAENQNVTTYTATLTYPDLHATGLFIKAPKNGEAAYYRADYTNEEAITFAQSSILGLSAIFSRQGNNEYAGFTVNAKMQKDDSGVMMASVFYKGIAVASLNINAKRDAAYLFIGLIQSENLAADKAILSSIPAQPVGTLRE